AGRSGDWLRLRMEGTARGVAILRPGAGFQGAPSLPGQGRRFGWSKEGGLTLESGWDPGAALKRIPFRAPGTATDSVTFHVDWGSPSSGFGLREGFAFAVLSPGTGRIFRVGDNPLALPPGDQAFELVVGPEASLEASLSDW